MARAKKSPKAAAIQLPKDVLTRIHIGHSFAEYDTALQDRDVYVQTPALKAALNPDLGKTIFVGRRGTGKTAIARHLEARSPRATIIRPGVFSPAATPIRDEHFQKMHQKPFKSLVIAFEQAVQHEIARLWLSDQQSYMDGLPPAVQRMLTSILDWSFDKRVIRFTRELLNQLAAENEEEWLRLIKEPEAFARGLKDTYNGKVGEYTVIFDSIDDSWDGSDRAVIYLSALMHALLQLTLNIPWARGMLFLRENIFDRVRDVDREFSRLETHVVGLDWTQELLLEMVERRLNRPLHTRLPLGGETWSRFFEQPEDAKALVFTFCQNRPRDVLMYCSYAIEAAQSHKHEVILVEDLLEARRRFSDNRLKDLGDEYAENYPQLAVVLSKFYGLGQRFTLSGIDSLLKRLVIDDDIRLHCSEWFFDYAQPEQFVRLLYNVGFLGLQSSRGVTFRSVGPRDTTPPPVSSATDIVVHPSFYDALDLDDRVVSGLGEEELGRRGLVGELPDSLDLATYTERLSAVEEELRTLPTGPSLASTFEDLLGDVIRLCFFRALGNLEERSRDVNGRVVRDWIASNRANGGFWEMVRVRYGASQVVWEAKNYAKLEADDFQQAAYYMNSQIGMFVVIVYRGEMERHYYEHIRRVAHDKSGMILLLGERDLQVFLRQARKGKISEDHIRDRYDDIVRRVS